MMTNLDKVATYKELVAARKACFDCNGLYNPSRIENGRFDGNHVGPWTSWQGNLNAKLMVVGQDWGGDKYFKCKKGREKDTNSTNVRLRAFLEQIGVKIEMSGHSQGPGHLYFTNAILCCREGLLTTGGVKSAWFRNCESKLRAQIELVRPKVVVTLGYFAYRSVLSSFGVPPKSKMREAIRTTNIHLPGQRSIVVPVYHCGNNGTRSRPLEHQAKDWNRVKAALES
ncbi:MAG TPA: uracil-DNA glycosylase family protein [Candidatus Angelobacter sp.]|jgi:DNA polymerase|nr:uracil-DNA glycosylase family protein [Candidatus Angelobacter sp.]